MPPMKPLGRSGLAVAPLAFGGNVFGWTADEATSFRLLDRFVESGFNLVDTADVYSRWVTGHVGGESERVIGRWLRQGGGRRERIVLATKVGMDMGPGGKGLRPAHIRASVDASLQRLQTDRIDLYQAHADDPDTPLEDTLGAFADLILAGKVRAIGASNYGAARLHEALETSRRLRLPRFETLQPQYNLVDRAPYEAELQAVCVAEGLGVVNYYGLARGFLSGKYRGESDLGRSPRGGSVKASYFNARGWRVLAALDAVAERHRSTPAPVALAWQMRQPGIVAPIVSATSIAQWDELAQAASLALSDEDLAELAAASA